MTSKIATAAIVAAATYTVATAPVTNAGMTDSDTGNVGVTFSQDWPQPAPTIVLEIAPLTEGSEQ
ncbi:MAG: hypothetical protein V4678_02895 [Patescibacteria group bacterium]